MSDESHDEPAGDESGDGFDMDQIHRLGSIMDKFDLSEIRLRRSTDAAEEQWTLRRGAQIVAAAAAPAAAAPQAAPVAPTTPAPASSGGEAPAAAAPTGKTIDSPTVGTFYSRPNPDDPAFVSAGDSVSPDTIVCLIEAMKVFNQIPAETSGTIAKTLVKDGDAVEFGQPLFELA